MLLHPARHGMQQHDSSVCFVAALALTYTITCAEASAGGVQRLSIMLGMQSLCMMRL
jgi:hypothetical protein